MALIFELGSILYIGSCLELEMSRGNPSGPVVPCKVPGVFL